MNINFNLNELDLREIGEWPWPLKIMTIGISCLLLLFLGYWTDTKSQLNRLDVAQQEVEKLRLAFEQKQAKTANIEVYKRQMTTMKISYGVLLRQLPEKTEVSGLIEDISHQGLATGLEFKTIRLLPEKQVDFYSELPIEMSVVGNYHQLGAFVSDIAALPRIVTLHDFDIQPTTEGLGDKLVMNITAKTYSYMADQK